MNAEAPFVLDLAVLAVIAVLALAHPYLALGLLACAFMWRGTK